MFSTHFAFQKHLTINIPYTGEYNDPSITATPYIEEPSSFHHPLPEEYDPSSTTP